MRAVDVVALVLLGLCLVPDVILWVLVFDNDRRPAWHVGYYGDYEIKTGAKWWEPLWLAAFWTGTLALFAWAWVLHYHSVQAWELIEADPTAALCWPPLLTLAALAPVGLLVKKLFPRRSGAGASGPVDQERIPYTEPPRCEGTQGAAEWAGATNYHTHPARIIPHERSY